jgi:hypothetical protein
MQYRRTGTACLGLAVTLLGLMLGRLVPAIEPPSKPDDNPGVQQVKPRWRVGDRWIVETLTLQLQARRDTRALARGKPVRWEFTVKGQEKVGARDCYRVEVRCLVDGRPQPLTTLWCDQQSLALQQLQTRLPVPGGYRAVTENYQSPGGQPSPVLAPLTALPVDMPLFLGAEAKSTERFTYETHSSPDGQKAVGEVGFAFEVEQQIARAEPEQVKGLLAAGFAKDLKSQPVTEVRLKAFNRQVYQLWQPDLPWPSYSDNGSTVSRLVQVIPADARPEKQPEVKP